MEMNFCRRCGTPLTNIGQHVYTCKNDHTIFANSAPAAGIIFINDTNDHIMLGQRARDPNKGKLDNFGGFLDEGESFEDSFRRELHEEAGLSPEDYDPPVYLSSSHDSYAYGGESLPIVGCLYWSRLKPHAKIRPGDDIASAAWFSLHGLDLSLVHSQDTRDAIGILRTLFPQ